MAGNINNKPESESFDVVQFIELPFVGINDYICVPHSWIQISMDEGALVAYPNDEDPSVTRDRVKRNEKYDNDWKFYLAAFKYTSNTYTDAEEWIMKTNKYGTLVQKDSKTSDTQPKFPLNRKLHSLNRNHSSKFKRPAPSSLNKQLNGKQMKLSDAVQSHSAIVTDGKTKSNPRFPLNKKLHSVNRNQSSKFNNNSRKPLSIKSPKQPAPLSLKKQLDGNQMKLSNAAQSSSAVVTDSKTQSNRERLINNQTMGYVQTDKAAAASSGNVNTKRTPNQRDEQNIQTLNLPVIDFIDLSEDNNIDEENDSQGIKMANKNKSQCHLVSNTMAVLTTAKEPSTFAIQTTLQIQYNNQEHMSDAAQLSNFVTDDKTKSNRERLNIIQINQSMECDQTDEAAAASIGNESTERRTATQRAEPNKQALSLPVIDVNEPAEVIVVEGIKKPDKKNSQSHLVSNTTAISVTPKEPPTSAKQTTQPNQYNNKEHILYSPSSSNFKPRMENVRSVANVHIEHKLLIQEIANDTQSTSHDTLSSVKKSAQLNNDINGLPRFLSTQESVENEMRALNIKRDLALAAENPQSNLMDHTASSSVRSAEEQLSVVSQNHSQDGLPVRETQTGNSKEQTVPLGSSVSRFEKTQHVPKTNPHDTTFVDPRNVSNRGKCFHQNSFQPTYPNSIQQHILREPKESNKYDLRPNSPIIRKEIPSTGQNTINPCNPLYRNSELSHKKQSQLNQQELQQQPQTLKGEQRYTSNIATQRKNLVASHQNPSFHQSSYSPSYHNSFQRDLIIQYKEGNNYDYRPNCPTFRQRVPSSGLNSTNSCNPSYLNPYLPQQIQYPLHQQNLQPPPQILKGEQRYTSNIVTQVRNISYGNMAYPPTHQNWFQQNHHSMRIPSTELNTTNPYNPFYLNSNLPQQKPIQLHQEDLQQQIQKSQRRYTRNTATQERLKEYKKNNKRKRIPNTGPNSANHVVNSVANAETNNIVISDHEMSTVDAPIETNNNLYCNETASGSRCVDKPKASQNSTFPNCQTHPEVVLEQQMLNNFATLLTQMSYTLHSTRDMYNNLQSSIRDTVELYEQLLGEVKEFNTAEYSISNASPASNLTPESPVERHIQVPPRANSSNDNQHIKNVSFVLPP